MRPKFDDVRRVLLQALRGAGWTVVDGLKVPHATSPDGACRLWFKSQSIHMNDPGTSCEFKNAHSVSSDMRDVQDGEQLLRLVERWRAS